MQKIVVLMALLGGACAKTDWSKVTSEMEDLRDKLCSCKDKTCVDDAEAKMKALHASVDGKSGRPDDLDKIFNGIRECEDKVANRGIVRTMSKYRDMMCACKDADCAKGVDGGAKDEMRVDFARYEPTPDEAKQLAAITKQTADCMTHAMAGSGAATAPPP